MGMAAADCRRKGSLQTLQRKRNYEISVLMGIKVMNGKIFLAKAISKAIKWGVKAYRQAPLPKPAKVQATENIKLLDILTSSRKDSVDFKRYLLVPNEDGTEYKAVIKEPTQDIVVQSELDGIPVTGIEWISEARYDNKVRLFVPETVKRLELDVLFTSSYKERKGRWLKLFIDEKNPYLVTENRCVYSKDKTILYAALCKTNFFTVPDGVIEIADHAFEGNNYIIEVTLPKSVRAIGKGAFEYCRNLRKVDFSNTEIIKPLAFYGCLSLKSFMCPDLRELGERAFEKCYTLYSVRLPKTLEKIGKSVFTKFNRCIEFYDSLYSPFVDFFTLTDHYDITVTVRSAETGLIKFKLYLLYTVMTQNKEFGALIRNSWKPYGEFELEKFDEALQIIDSDRYIYFTYTFNAVYRLTYPYKLSEDQKALYIDFLKNEKTRLSKTDLSFHFTVEDLTGIYREKIYDITEFASILLSEGKFGKLNELINMIEGFCKTSVYTADDVIPIIDFFTGHYQQEYTARMLEIRNRYFPYCDTLSLDD